MVESHKQHTRGTGSVTRLSRTLSWILRSEKNCCFSVPGKAWEQLCLHCVCHHGAGRSRPLPGPQAGHPGGSKALPPQRAIILPVTMAVGTQWRQIPRVCPLAAETSKLGMCGRNTTISCDLASGSGLKKTLGYFRIWRNSCIRNSDQKQKSKRNKCGKRHWLKSSGRAGGTNRTTFQDIYLCRLHLTLPFKKILSWI